MSDVDCIVIGAGVVGLAIARAVALTGREVVIVERERAVGMHTSSRNSEVIHAGIHYAAGSYKAQLCLAGRKLLYAYCASKGIAHRRCGKFTVAASAAEIPHLQQIEKNALANGVSDLEWLDGAAARQAEPALQCVAALSSPSTGIIDSHGLMQSLLGDALGAGADIGYATRVTRLRPQPAGGVEVFIDGQPEPTLSARHAVNCAGLWATQVAACIDDFPAARIAPVHYARGNYYTVPGRSPFSRLIYPAPGSGGHLGIHMTLDLAGGARFGPDMQWLDQVDYTVDATQAPHFAAAIRRYWPLLPAERLTPAYAGVRPKLSAAGEPARDFVISGPRDHGVPGVINLFGIESPGLTASLALAEHVATLLED